MARKPILCLVEGKMDMELKQMYDELGNTIINLTNKSENIKEIKKTERQISFNLCDNETIDVNGINYNSTGIYNQKLTNKAGCDSTLTITIDKYISTESFLNIQLCDDETGIINGIVYNEVEVIHKY